MGGILGVWPVGGLLAICIPCNEAVIQKEVDTTFSQVPSLMTALFPLMFSYLAFC